ncbi:hypothetical protein DFR30_0781 [Thiogranum longum]|uniref:2-oxoglutarate-Fe(II)-dependent oxygenase superfamily protein n=1 Tax=Thiogranum longum TaxID=1537524 RepID=A0A4R1H8H6_9GAMM|nr:putative 2OG-Fe(II) oxygenase [Thiogranum longum]TCK17548.1 hypothetical protein DFR30_0781 [Thiogranum longum]
MSKQQNLDIHYGLVQLADSVRLNEAVRAQYRALKQANSAAITHSHYFEGRYENTYVPASVLTGIQPVLDIARREAAAFLKTEVLPEPGFWLNEMAPGHVTLAHRHDEDDELLSGVYYIDVPENSGDLVLEQGCVTTRIRPQAGMLVLFPPDVLHHVTQNLGKEIRLSVGMNFGIRD